MTLLMLALFMTAGALMLTIAIRARLVARANFAAIQQTALADTVPREALDEALLAALRGSISGTNGSVVVTGGNASLECENLIADKFGSSLTGQGLTLVDTDKPVMQVTVRSLSPVVSAASRLNGRILTIKPRPADGDICSFRILGSTAVANPGEYICYLANLPRLIPKRLPPASSSFDIVINGREFTPVQSGTGPESWDGFDDQNKWLAQPIVQNGEVAGMERVSFLGGGQSLTSTNAADNDNDGVFDGVWLPASVAATGSTPPPYVIADRPSPLGGTLRFQVSYLILDLDGRININAAGATDSHSPQNYADSPAVPLGMGYGPADIDCSLLFPRTSPDPTNPRPFDDTWLTLLKSGSPQRSQTQDTTQRRRQPMIGTVDGRYGASGSPGRLDDDVFGSGQKPLNQRTSASRYLQTISGTNAVADLKASSRVYMTAPSGDSLTPTLNYYRPLDGNVSDDYVDDPYEVRLDRAAPRMGVASRGLPSGAMVNDDNVFTLEEMERLLRPNDSDINGRPQRLASGLGSIAQQTRMLVTSDSWDSPAIRGLAARKLEDFYAATSKSPALMYSGTAWASTTSTGGISPKTNPVAPDVAAGLKFDINRPVLAGTSSAALKEQHEYCKGLFTLVRALADGSNPAVTAVEAAQWAVNVLDFRDEDSVCTGFEYDTDLTDGWDVDGDLSTTSDPDRAVVWGAERPELVIVETAGWRKSSSPNRQLFVTIHRPAQNALRTRKSGGVTLLDQPVHQSDYGSSLNLSQTHDGSAAGSQNGSAIWRLRFDASKVVEFKNFNQSNPPNDVLGSSTGMSSGSFPVTLPQGGYLCVCSPNPTEYSISTGVPRFEVDLVNGNDKFDLASNTGTVSLERLANPGAAFDATTNPYLAVDTAYVEVVQVEGAQTAQKRRRQGPQDSGSSKLAGFWRTGTLSSNPSEWVAGNAILGKYVTSGTYTGSTVSTGTAPVAWFHWPNRPFISQAELMLVPSGTSSTSGMLQNYSYPSNSLATGTAAVTVNSSTVTVGSLLMDATYVPSRFADNAITISGTQPNVKAVGFDNLKEMQLSKWREPGRVNVNTTVSGSAASTDDIVWQLVINGTATGNPFKTSAKTAKSTWDIVTLSGTSPYESFASTGATFNARDKNPYFAAARAIRLANTTTTNSNVFAIWVTVRITDDSTTPKSVVTKRLFAIVDRSIPVGYKPNEDLNVRDCIRLKRYLD